MAAARWARLKLTSRVFDDYLKFAVVRNPFDRAVSYYHYLSQRPEHHRYERVGWMSFKGFLAQRRAFKDSTQLRFSADEHGVPLVDHVLRFESLAEDFSRLCHDLGVPAACALPRNNTSRHGPFWAYYEDDYNRTLRGICSRRTSRRFGYSTDVPSAELMVLPPQASEFETPILNKPVDVDLLERVLDRWRPAA